MVIRFYTSKIHSYLKKKNFLNQLKAVPVGNKDLMPKLEPPQSLFSSLRVGSTKWQSVPVIPGQVLGSALPQQWFLCHRQNSGMFQKLPVQKGEGRVGWGVRWALGEGVGPDLYAWRHCWRQALISLPLRLEQAHRKLPFAAVQTMLAELQHSHCPLQLFHSHSFIGRIQRKIRNVSISQLVPFQSDEIKRKPEG